jgi:hypothetical protein
MFRVGTGRTTGAVIVYRIGTGKSTSEVIVFRIGTGRSTGEDILRARIGRPLYQGQMMMIITTNNYNN